MKIEWRVVYRQRQCAFNARRVRKPRRRHVIRIPDLLYADVVMQPMKHPFLNARVKRREHDASAHQYALRRVAKDQ